MGTVLSFSPRERRPIYSTQHSSFGAGSTGTLSNSNSADFQLNNYSYEQLNNVKNRENTKPPNLQTVPNHHNNYQSNTNNNNLTNITNHHNMNNHHGNSLALLGGQTHMNNTNRENNNMNNNHQERSADTARILSEKNALEKNLKKHSLFINALSWKRLAASHNKKKQLVDNNKNKAANLPTATFRKLSPNEILLKTSYITSSCHSSPVVVYDDNNQCYEEDENVDCNHYVECNDDGNAKKNKINYYFDSSSSSHNKITNNNNKKDTTSHNNHSSTTTMPILLPLFTQNNSHSSYIENVHPSLVTSTTVVATDKNKNAQQQQQQLQQQQQQTQSDCNGVVSGGQTVYFTPNGPKTLLPLDLMRANNTAPLQPTDKLGTKIPLHLPLGLQQQQQQQIQHQHAHGPRKTVIQVS